MNKLKLTSFLALFAFLVLPTSIARAECGEVSISEMNWGSGVIVTQVSKFLLENGYGCKVAVVPSSTNPAVASVTETGKPDIVTELWVNSVPTYDQLVKEKKIRPLTAVLSDGAVEAWYVPTYLAEKHPELKTLDGVLANPDLVGGRFHNCPSGWACQIVNNNNLKALDVESKGFKVFTHGSGQTLATSIASAHSSKKPWFGYYWAPTAVLGKYPMTRVKMKLNKKAHKCNTDKNCANPGVSAYPPSDVLTVVTEDFRKRERDATKLMKKVNFTNDQMNGVLAWQKDNKASGEEAAVYFLTTYKDVWKKWLSKDARKKLATIIN